MFYLVIILIIAVVFLGLLVGSNSSILAKFYSDLEAVEAKAGGTVKSDITIILADLKNYL